VRALLENLIRYAMEPRPKVEAKILSITRLHDIHISQAHALNDAELVMFGLGEHCPKSIQELVGEAFELVVCCGLKDNAVFRHEDAGCFFLGSVLPPLLLDSPDRHTTSRSEDKLLHFAGALERKSMSSKFLLN
jgi:hypothetical protein